MVHTEESLALTKAFSGLGVDEKLIISIAEKWRPEDTNSFRQESELFVDDGHYNAFQKWDGSRIKLLELEFLRLKEAVVLWTMHPWERDARLIKESLVKGSEMYGVLVEIACTRSSEELLGARKAYHSLFDRSIEEDIGHRVAHTSCRNFLVALMSIYRYEGPKVNEEIAKKEAKIIANAIKNSDVELIKSEEIFRILTTRSKSYLKVIYNHYKELYGKNIDEDLKEDELILKEAVQCLCSPHTYFSKVLDKALDVKADEYIKDALTQVVVSRADIDMKGIKEEYQKVFGVSLSEKIEETTNGNYKEFLLSLISRGEE